MDGLELIPIYDYICEVHDSKGDLNETVEVFLVSVAHAASHSGASRRPDRHLGASGAHSQCTVARIAVVHRMVGVVLQRFPL